LCRINRLGGYFCRVSKLPESGSGEIEPGITTRMRQRNRSDSFGSISTGRTFCSNITSLRSFGNSEAPVPTKNPSALQSASVSKVTQGTALARCVDKTASCLEISDLRSPAPQSANCHVTACYNDLQDLFLFFAH